MALRAILTLVVAACGWAQAPGLQGLWLGTLEAGDVRLRIALTLTRSGDGAYSGKLDSIDQGIMGRPLSAVSLAGSAVHFAMPIFGGSFDGTLERDGEHIYGAWRKGRLEAPLNFRRVERFRPQDPLKPYPYLEEEARFGRLAGTLTLPRTAGPHPAVLLISGSGAQDRDGANAGHRPFLVLADFLTRRGIAVLRVEKPVESTIPERAADALAAVGFLKAHNGIDARHIGLVGHSEGGLVAPLAATESPDIAFIVLLAAPGVTGEELMLEQAYRLPLAMGVPEDMAARNRELYRAIFAILKREPDNNAARKQIRAQAARMKAGLSRDRQQAMEALIRRMEGDLGRLTSRSFRELLAYDPRPVLSKVRVPVLIMAGERDPLVPPRLNLPPMAAALETSSYKIVKLPALNHMLQTAETGLPMEEARIDETIAPAALRVLGEWISGITARSAP